MKYVSILKNGTRRFNKDFFQPIANIPGFSKPLGGFWASPIDAKYGWKEWCKENGEWDWLTGDAFVFEIPDSARVLRIEKIADILYEYLDSSFCDPERYALAKDSAGFCNPTLPLDFEKLAEKFDAVEILAGSNYDLYNAFYGWDCDSILIMNPDIIVESEE